MTDSGVEDLLERRMACDLLRSSRNDKINSPLERRITMTDLTLHPMKEIRIIIQGEHLKFATDLLDDKATGYTIIHNISGKGHHGFHTAHPMFNEMDSIVMLMTVVTPEKVEPILAG
jgi:hypothetical protein